MWSEMIDEVAKKGLAGIIGWLKKAGTDWLRRRHDERFFRTFTPQLDELIDGVLPCFVVQEQTSFEQVFYGAQLAGRPEYDHIARSIKMVSGWFRCWRELRRTAGPEVSPLAHVAQLAALRDILFYASETGVRIRELFLVGSVPAHCGDALRVSIDRYDHFLTRYEAVLRRAQEHFKGTELAERLGTQLFLRRAGRLEGAADRMTG